MSDYVVSARKYRPDSFETLIGQDNIARTLKNSILRGQLAHAYLFCGPRGVGKTSAARIFAKTINCSNPGPDMEPCGECESCLSFKEGRSYCIHELDAASNNGVEDIKALMEQVQIPPQVGKYSVFIIDEVHMLSSQAFNAFLKTLEEPPAHAIFILATTEKHKIIPTILSRCQTYDFNRISVPDIVRNLKDIASRENIKVDDESLHVIAHKADGAMRDALTIFDQTVAFCGADIRYEDVLHNLNVLDYEYSFKLVDAFLASDHAAALLEFDEILRKGFNALHFVTSLSSHLRDLIVSKTGGLDSLLDLPDSLKSRYKDQASRCPMKFLYDALGITTQCEAGYRSSANQRLHIEFALMKLAFLSGVPSPAVEKSPDVPVAVPPAVQPSRPSQPKAAAKKVAKLSLSSLLDDEDDMVIELSDEKKEGQPGMPEAPKAPELPTDEEILQKWQDLAQLQNAQPRLANALAHSKLSMSVSEGIKTVEFAVVNEAQKQWIETKILRNLEAKFCELVSCGKIRLVPTVIPEEEQEKVKYMPSEKAEDLMNKNVEVRNLVSDLGLDIR